MLASMAIFRIVAASHMSASPTQTKMNPSVAHNEAFLTTITGRYDGLYRREVCALLARIGHLYSRYANYRLYVLHRELRRPSTI
jgi:hypothetical protein